MAERRMFAKTIIDSDAFLDMPLSTQALYFHLSMRADDDGFINNPKKIQRVVGASEDDLKVLLAKGFLIPFESGIVVIKHWRIHNYIQSDRYKRTVYLEEKKMLDIKENKAYTLKNNEMDTRCIHDGYSLEAQVRLGKDSIGKVSIGKVSIEESVVTAEAVPAPSKEQKHSYGEFKHVKLTDIEYQKLIDEYGDIAQKCITFLDEYIERKGYKAKSHYLCIRGGWVLDAVKERERKSSSGNKAAEQLDSAYQMMQEWRANRHE